MSVKRDWESLFKQLCKYCDKFEEVSGGDQLFMYGERTMVGALAAAAIQSGWFTKEEFAINKKNRGSRTKSLGRADLELFHPRKKESYVVEAKINKIRAFTPKNSDITQFKYRNNNKYFKIASRDARRSKFYGGENFAVNFFHVKHSRQLITSKRDIKRFCTDQVHGFEQGLIDRYKKKILFSDMYVPQTYLSQGKKRLVKKTTKEFYRYGFLFVVSKI